jgi:hypothetical protein
MKTELINAYEAQKCDGLKPTCTACLRYGGDAICIYQITGENNNTQDTEMELSRLRSQLLSTESGVVDDIVRLSDPYTDNEPPYNSVSRDSQGQESEQTRRSTEGVTFDELLRLM